MKASAQGLPPNSATLAWTPSPATDIAGYRVYWGVASRNYSNEIDVGPATVATASPLVAGVTYYFAATSYDVNGLESPFSGEISYTVPVATTTKANFRLAVNSTRQVVLSGTAPNGYSYDVLASHSLTNWSNIGSVTADLVNGTIQFIDPRPVTNEVGFYRLRQSFP